MSTLKASTIKPKTILSAIGLIAMTFPAVMYFGANIYCNCVGPQSSISAYYHTGMRDVFVGLLIGIAFLMFAYNGYDKVDAILAKCGSVFAAGVAFFPTSVLSKPTTCIEEIIVSKVDTIHFTCAALLFFILAYFCIFRFTKSDKEIMDKMKKVRNTVYTCCGVLILLSMIFIAGYIHFIKDGFAIFASYKPVFWLESLALFSFSIAWGIKSGIFWDN